MAIGRNQLRGALLEEAILYLLQRSGYKVVLTAGADSTLRAGGAGLEVRGRGAWHQIDAISDFRVTPSFTNPQRLLVEGKCLSKSVGLPIVRNGLGVLKDVSENWLLTGLTHTSIPAKRHHYLYAIFSATDFSKPAQDYAFAHDLPLLALRHSAFFRPILDAINMIDSRGPGAPPNLMNVRRYVRARLLGTNEVVDDDEANGLDEWLGEYLDSCATLRLGFITMFGGQFPAFLVARDIPGVLAVDGPITVRIRWLDQSWYIEKADSQQQLFSFDLPQELFDLYSERGRLNQNQVANLKSDVMREFYAFYSEGDQIRLVTFRLDEPWIDAIKRQRNG